MDNRLPEHTEVCWSPGTQRLLFLHLWLSSRNSVMQALLTRTHGFSEQGSARRGWGGPAGEAAFCVRASSAGSTVVPSEVSNRRFTAPLQAPGFTRQAWKTQPLTASSALSQRPCSGRLPCLRQAPTSAATHRAVRHPHPLQRLGLGLFARWLSLLFLWTFLAR